MNINILRLSSELSRTNPEIRKTGDQFIEDLNNELFEDDFVLTENAKDSLFTAVFIETGGSETAFLNILPSLSDPVVLLSDGKNNSLPAALEIKTYLDQHHRDCYFLTGGEGEIASILSHIGKIVSAAESAKNAFLGVIGEPSDWLIASRVSPSDVFDHYGINLVNIPLEELYEAISHPGNARIPREKELETRFPDKEALHQAFRIYRALLKLVDKYHLKGLTIRCFDMLGKYRNTACLALALLNEEGIVSACEGDVPSLLTMFFLHCLTGMPSFMANPSRIDYQERTILLAHCTVPFSMTKSYTLDTHFESGLGVAVHGEMPLSPVTIVKLTPSLKASDALVLPATIKSSPSLPGYCRTQVVVTPEEDGIFTFLKCDFGNHLILTYADVMDDFYPFLAYLETRTGWKN